MGDITSRYSGMVNMCNQLLVSSGCQVLKKVITGHRAGRVPHTSTVDRFMYIACPPQTIASHLVVRDEDGWMKI